MNRFFGTIFLLGGIAAMGCFLLAFDTTIPGSASGDLADAGQRTHNLGLIADRICGILVGGFMAVVGAFLSEVAPRGSTEKSR